jgi:hypothetical protein
VWFKVNDQLSFEKKVIAIPRKQRCAAMGLWVLAGSWCSRELNGGHLPEYMVDELSGDQKMVAALLKVNLWERADDGYQFHDWDDWNPSKADAALLKAARSDASKFGNHKRWHADKGIVNPDCTYCNPIPNLSQMRSQTGSQE